MRERKGAGGFCGVAAHYDRLIDEGNDPVRDGETLRAYMDKWDGQLFLDLLALKPDDDVLEIGVGTGRLALRTSPLCRSLTGIDLSQKTVERARENLAGLGNVTLICGDFLTCRFERTFDVVYSSLTFLHIREKRRAVEKAAALLKAHGRLVVSLDKNPSPVIDFGDRRIEVYPDTPDATREAFAGAGLRAVSVKETEFAYIVYGEKP